MTMNKLTERLARNAVDFMLAGDIAKSNACMTLLSVIKEKGLENVKGKLLVDNI